MFWKRNKKQSYTVLMDMDLDTLVSAESELGPVVFAFTDHSLVLACSQVVAKNRGHRIAGVAYEAKSREDFVRKLPLAPGEASVLFSGDPGVDNFVMALLRGDTEFSLPASTWKGRLIP